MRRGSPGGRAGQARAPGGGVTELIAIEGSSYRLKEATERAAAKAKTRSAKRKA
jgi:hypothetical protein